MFSICGGNSGFSMRILASSEDYDCAVHCGPTIISSDRSTCIFCSSGAIRLKGGKHK